VCFSGPARSIELTGDHLRRTLGSVLGAYQVFAYLPSDPDRELLEAVFPKRLVCEVAPDEPIEELGFPKGYFKTGRQKYLQQIHGWYQVNRMRKEFGAFDYVIRCRTDVFFTTPIPRLETLDPNKIHLPDFHHWGGYNDRFCISGPVAIDSYMDIFPLAMAHREQCYHAETFLKWCLEFGKVEVDLIEVKFNRVRIQPDT